jgi:hypothetical protein
MMAQSTIAAPEPLLLGEWCAELATRAGIGLKLRPANPDDEPLLADFFEHMRPEDVRFRFLTPVPHPGHPMLASLVDVDHVSDENFLAFTLGMPRVSVGKSGSIRAHCASENQKKSAICSTSWLEATESQRGETGNPVYGSGP